MPPALPTPFIQLLIPKIPDSSLIPLCLLCYTVQPYGQCLLALPPKYISKLTLLLNFCLPILVTISSCLSFCISPLHGFSSSTLVSLQCILNPANQWNDTRVNQVMANFPMSCYLFRITPKTYDSPQGPLWFDPWFFLQPHCCLSSHHPQCSIPLISLYLFQTPYCLCTCCSFFLEWLYLPQLYNSFSLLSLHYPQVTSWDRTSLLTPSYPAPPLFSFLVLFFSIIVITTNWFFFFFVYNMKAGTYLFTSLFRGTWEEL